MEQIDIKNISFGYGPEKPVVLDDVSLKIGAGEFVCLAGHSGCGKTTLLNLVAGLQPADRGEILIGGKKVTGPGVDRSVVFQHYSLFPWLTARGNVAFGIGAANPGMKKKEADSLAREYLVQVELQGVLNHYPYQLSGGMQQRVAIARAFAMSGRILLLDEPFGALDTRIRCKLQEMLSELWQKEKEKKTILFVTHDIEEAIVLADRIVFMKPRKIQEEIQVDFSRPRNRRSLMQTAECCAMRKNLIEMFYQSQEDEGEGQ